MIVTERFQLNPLFTKLLRRRKAKFGFGLLGAAAYYRTYSRTKPNGQQEDWADTVIRTVEGAMSILKTHCVENNIPFDEEHWQREAINMAEAIHEFRMLPPGRGLFAGGTEHVYEKGSGALNNCSASTIKKLSDDAAWCMNFLMLGVGVGYDTHRYEINLKLPVERTTTYVVPDSREGWVEATRRLIASYEEATETVLFDYSDVRPFGAPIRGFGGTASGPGPLKEMHEDMRKFLHARATGEISSVRLIADTINRIAKCIVAGNVRRSALICLGSPQDDEFLDLKNWKKYPERNGVNGWGHTSNNSPIFESPEDFNQIPDIAERIRLNGEPGVVNMMNIQKYARFGDKKHDPATLVNPCVEIPLENKELCNLVEVFPTRCKTEADLFDAMRLATIYASCISLLRTDSEETNAVIAKNRRIGVSLSGIADWFEATRNKSDIVRILNAGYDLVRITNKEFAKFAKVPAAIRVTTVKPSGTISLLAGVSPGMHHPIFSTHIRRVKFGVNAPVVPLLMESGLPYEPDKTDPSGTLIFEFPIHVGKVRGQDDVSLFEHGARLVLLSKFWADNAVSNTITFNQDTESHLIEPFLTYNLPFVKSISMLPLTTGDKIYEQAPYEKINEEEYQRRMDQVRDIDWSKYTGTDGEDAKFCNNDTCAI